MDVHIKEDFEDLGFRVTVTADDGFDIELHIEPDKDEVSEIYFSGYDFPPEAPFLDSVYVIIAEKPVSIQDVISEVTSKIEDLREEISLAAAEQADYESGQSFYYNHGRI